MKIATVNTHTYGGAATVAKRIHYALLKLNHDSVFVSQYGIPGNIPRHVFFKNATLQYFVRKKLTNPYLSTISKYLKKKIQSSNLANRPEGFEIFSTLQSSTPTSRFELLSTVDIIHLHWVSNFIDYKSFFTKFPNKKYVWTLHDMSPITGGCHHSDGCHKFESVCSPCPQLKNTIDENYSEAIQRVKTEALSQLRDDQLFIVSPSKWLMSLSEKSRITGRFRHFHIPNPSFEPVNFQLTRAEVRKQLKLPKEKKIILFASENLNNPRKGISFLFDALRITNQSEDILLVGIGHKAMPQQGLNITYTGILSDFLLMANYFYAADLFVTPTLAENSPLVIIESLTCGTPVVASNVGGIPDLINQDNGILFPKEDTQALSKAIYSALFEIKFDRNKIANDAQACYDPTKVALSYNNLYKLFS